MLTPWVSLGLEERCSAGATHHPERNVLVREVPIITLATLKSPHRLCTGEEIPAGVGCARGHSLIPRGERSEMQFGLLWEKKASSGTARQA